MSGSMLKLPVDSFLTGSGSFFSSRVSSSRVPYAVSFPAVQPDVQLLELVLNISQTEIIKLAQVSHLKPVHALFKGQWRGFPDQTFNRLFKTCPRPPAHH